MERLIRDLLDVTAIESGALAIVRGAIAVPELLGETIDAHTAACEQAGIDLQVAPSHEIPTLVADSARLLQVLGNLIGNALKYTPRGGRIVVGADYARGEVTFWVADTGEGIPPDQVPHIFDKYRRRRARSQDGVGFGLGICKAIVETHGGRLWVESVVGKGTIVSFAMPIDDKPKDLTQGAS
jgi:signal transduction histidine kinase